MFEYKQIFKEQAIYPDLDLKDGSGRYEIVIKITSLLQIRFWALSYDVSIICMFCPPFVVFRLLGEEENSDTGDRSSYEHPYFVVE